MNNYSRVEYWDERYSKDADYFEWYQTYQEMRPFLQELLSSYTDPTILHIGCGTSKFTEELLQEGYRNITNIDYSEVCIEKMKEKIGERNSIIFKKMDVREMSFESASFDFALDKGTLDSILCVETPHDHVVMALNQISRVLRPGGTYFYISYGKPEQRTSYLENAELNWSVTIKRIAKPQTSVTDLYKNEENASEEKSYHYIYICKKATADS